MQIINNTFVALKQSTVCNLTIHTNLVICFTLIYSSKIVIINKIFICWTDVDNLHDTFVITIFTKWC